MISSFWEIVPWIYFLADIIAFAIVANWPSLPGQKKIMTFFGIHIFCTVGEVFFRKSSFKIEEVTLFYSASSCLRLIAMFFLIYGLFEIGTKISSENIKKNNDWEHF